VEVVAFLLFAVFFFLMLLVFVVFAWMLQVAYLLQVGALENVIVALFVALTLVLLFKIV
jgi:hypothetical protein